MINKFIQILDPHTKEVIKKSSSSLVVKVLGMFFSLLVSIFLGRTLGADGLGIINLSNKLIFFLVVIAMFGTENILVKQIAIAYSNKNESVIRNYLNTAFIFNGGITIVIIFILVLFSSTIANNLFNEPRLKIPLIIASVAMLPMVFSRIYGSALIGYKKIWQSNLVNQTLSIWTVGIFLLLAYLLKIDINVISVAVMYALGRLVVVLTTGIYWRSIFKKPHADRKFLLKKLIKPALPLLLMNASSIIATNADTIMIGAMRNSTEVGLYSVAARIALLTSFFLQITNSSVAPKIAVLYEKGNKTKIEKMVQQVTKGLIYIGVFSLFIFIIFGQKLLLLWGPEFQNAYFILIILGFGQFINLGTGAVAQLLIMTGHEKIQGKISIGSLIVNIILNIILIRLWGALGAAIATATVIASENIARFIIVKNKIGIITIPLKRKNNE